MKKNTIKLIEPSCVSQQPPAQRVQHRVWPLLASMMIMEAVLENWAWNRRTTIVCVCAHLFALLHDLSNVSFYNLSHAFTRQPPKTKHVLPIENKSKGIC